jgi:hypothetical protein
MALGQIEKILIPAMIYPSRPGSAIWGSLALLEPRGFGGRKSIARSSHPFRGETAFVDLMCLAGQAIVSCFTPRKCDEDHRETE